MPNLDLTSAVDLSGILNKPEEAKAKQLPEPKTYHLLCALPEVEEEYDNGLIKASPMYADGTVMNFETDGVGRYLRFEFNDHHGVRRSARTFVDTGFDPPDIGGPIRIAYSSYLPAVFQISALLERSEYSFYIFCASIIFGALLVTAIFHAFRQLRHHKQTSKRY